MGASYSSDFDSVYNKSKPYIVAEEVPVVIATVEEKLKALENSKKTYLNTLKEIQKDVQFEDGQFDIILQGHGEKTKELLQSMFPTCSIEVTQLTTGGYSGGTGRNTYSDTYVNDTLRFKCQ